ncbi:MBL fold metallo-hydrolase [candidate division KSB1 bacterium]|nr:MBL fold metallo-hydrolase [candidate division KSB1 bacterium]
MTHNEQDQFLTDVKITVVFDNRTAVSGVKASWGFACVVTGAEETILFDTGADGSILMANLKQLGVEPESIDTVVLSHKDWDHVDGLDIFLQHRALVTVFLLSSFPGEIKKRALQRGAKVMEIKKPDQICPAVYTTGELKAHKNEQALVIRTLKGLVVITGCAHPGIINILKSVGKMFSDNIYMVLGGFHLLEKPVDQLLSIVAQFREMGIQYAGPTHCTGEEAKACFKAVYGEKYLELGVGRILRIV